LVILLDKPEQSEKSEFRNIRFIRFSDGLTICRGLVANRVSVPTTMAISKAKKSGQLKSLSDLLSKAKSVIVADYTGLSVNQTNDLRKKLAEGAGEMTVAKNSLLEKSLKDAKVVTDVNLKGQSALVTTTGDAMALIKSLFAFIKISDLPKVVFGVVDGKRIELAEIKALAEIPSREILLGRFMGSIKSPMSKLVIAFSEIAKKREVSI